MTRNVGSFDRLLRLLAALALAAGAALAPWPLATRLLALGLPALYMLFTAARGLCFGYLLMGKSTCSSAS